MAILTIRKSCMVKDDLGPDLSRVTVRTLTLKVIKRCIFNMASLAILAVCMVKLNVRPSRGRMTVSAAA